jgi:hypothetical protein
MFYSAIWLSKLCLKFKNAIYKPDLIIIIYINLKILIDSVIFNNLILFSIFEFRSTAQIVTAQCAIFHCPNIFPTAHFGPSCPLE